MPSPIIMKKVFLILGLLVLWAFTAWLLLPLIQLDSVNIENAKQYLYRSAGGILIMVILLGKTIFDLLYPQHVSQKKSLLNTVFLTVYSLVLAGGVIFMAARMIVVFLKSKDIGFPF